MLAARGANWEQDCQNDSFCILWLLTDVLVGILKSLAVPPVESLRNRSLPELPQLARLT